MTAKYLVRFDDMCPTMNWYVWAKIEQVLNKHDIKPILAVIPDNVDKKLLISPPEATFWSKVRAWQQRGWTIGLHGYQHRYITHDTGMIGLNARSEFAGLPREEQERKIRSGVKIFNDNGIVPDLWIAPAHSFDENTITVLKKFGITAISDGYSLYPFKGKNGIFWLPQQLWRFRRMPFGLWTVCYHHNAWTNEDLDQFSSDVSRYRSGIGSVKEISAIYRQRCRSFADRGFAVVFRRLLSLKKLRNHGQD